MCQVTAPPAVFLAGPLQAPLGWLYIGGLLALSVGAVAYNYRRYLRPSPPGFGRHAGLALIVCGLLSLLTGAVLLSAVVIPSSDALFAWWGHQFRHLYAQHCTTTALDDAFHHANERIGSWRIVTYWLAGVGGGAAFLWLIWVTWFARRTRAQPARP